MHGRHRRLRRVGAAPFAAALVVLALLGAAGLVKWAGGHSADKGCRDGLAVSVAAAPEIAPVLQSVVAHLPGNDNPRTCGRFTVTAVDPADIAAVLAQSADVTLAGLGQANGTVHKPDIWVPDSTIWLQRLQARSAGLVPTAAPSIAQSPLVLAMPEPVARSLGWPNVTLSWGDMMTRLLSGSSLRAGLADPTRDVTGLSGLLALRGVATGAANPEQVVVGGMRTLALGHSALRADVLSQFPRATDARTLAQSLAVAPLPEQSVIAYDAGEPPVPLVAVPFGGDAQGGAQGGAQGLDYPYVVLPGARDGVVQRAQSLLDALSGAGYQHELAVAGLRGPDGTAGSGFVTPPGTPSASPTVPTPVDPALIDQTLAMWTAVTQPARILTAIDVSGSMATPVPTAGGRTREQVTLQAAANGLALFSDAWSVGLWEFSTGLAGGRPYRQLVPIAPLSTNRQAHLAALAAIEPTGGDTGLYDTILAAYQEVQRGWDPGRLNDVVVMTDGRNDYPQGLTLDGLLAKLRAVVDPQRPIQVIVIGIGDDIGSAELQQIIGVTGGQLFVTADPAKIGDIFLQAISTRPR